MIYSPDDSEWMVSIFCVWIIIDFIMMFSMYSLFELISWFILCQWISCQQFIVGFQRLKFKVFVMGIQVTWCASFSWLEKWVGGRVGENTKNVHEFKINFFSHFKTLLKYIMST